jgi:diaminopimelate decarboxylase
VLVRVTPGVEAHTHEFVRTGQEDSKFGFSVSSGAATEAVAALELLPTIELMGVHAHIGSQVFEASSFEQAAAVLGAFFAPLGLPELVVCPT